MHDLIAGILQARDLSAAGKLFELSEWELVKWIESGLSAVESAFASPEFPSDMKAQSVVEIVLARLTSVIRTKCRETKTMEKWALRLSECLGSAGRFPLSNGSPHARIAADLLSVLYLHYSSAVVMGAAVGQTVALLATAEAGGDLARSAGSYLVLAAVHHAALVAIHTGSLVKRVDELSPLLRLLPVLFPHNPQPILDSFDQLMSGLGKKEPSEAPSLLQLARQAADHDSSLLLPHLDTLIGHLSYPGVPALLYALADKGLETELGERLEAVILGAHGLATQQRMGVVKLDNKLTESQPISNLSRPKSRSYSNLVNSQRTPSAPNSPFIRLRGEQKGGGDPYIGTESFRPRIIEAPKVRRGHWRDANRNSLFIIRPGTDSPQELLVLNSKGRVRLAPSPFRPITVSPPLPSDGSPLLRAYHHIGSTADLRKREAAKVTQSHVVTTFQPNMSITQRTGSGSSLTLQEKRASFQPNGGSSSAKIDGKRMVEALAPWPEEEPLRRFCRKHLHRIRAFADGLRSALPLPARLTVEERRGSRPRMRLHFQCSVGGSHCLAGPTSGPFPIKTRYPAAWLHFTFLMIQAKTEHLLGVEEGCVSELGVCWDALPTSLTKGAPFTALLTSAFPQHKEQQSMHKELVEAGFFDTLACQEDTGLWSCFACRNPKKVEELVRISSGGTLCLSGELKEKRGRWWFLKRWQTRTFTLSGRALFAGDARQGKERGRIDLRSVRSVRSLGRGRRRGGPRAFEIFTDEAGSREAAGGGSSLVLKARDGSEAAEWLQCLQIAVAQAHKTASPPAPDTSL